jgi:hypothetical protein
MGSQSCAFCCYHKRYMTVKRVKFKRCLSKLNGTDIGDCKHLIRLTRHPFWISIDILNYKHKTIKRKLRGYKNG